MVESLPQYFFGYSCDVQGDWTTLRPTRNGKITHTFNSKLIEELRQEGRKPRLLMRHAYELGAVKVFEQLEATKLLSLDLYDEIQKRRLAQVGLTIREHIYIALNNSSSFKKHPPENPEIDRRAISWEWLKLET